MTKYFIDARVRAMKKNIIKAIKSYYKNTPTAGIHVIGFNCKFNDFSGAKHSNRAYLSLVEMPDGILEYAIGSKGSYDFIGDYGFASFEKLNLKRGESLLWNEIDDLVQSYVDVYAGRYCGYSDFSTELLRPTGL